MTAPAERELGRTGVRLTELGLGGAPLGDLFVRLTDGEAEGVLEAAWACGVRYYDTAPYYGHGQSEHRVGRFLRTRPRDEFVLSTKVGRVLRVGGDRIGSSAGGLPFGAVFDYGYDGVLRSYEDSLQRLGLARVDLLVIHDLDPGHHGTGDVLELHLERLATGGRQALEELRRSGDVRAIGAGANVLGMIPRLLDRMELDFVLLAMPYTLLHQEALEEELPLLVERGLGVVVGAPFQSGVLAGTATYNYGDVPPDVERRVRALRAACERHGVSLQAAALQLPLAHPAVASVIPGAVGAEQVRENATHVAAPIPEALWRELKEEGLLRPDAPVPSGA